MKYGLSESDIEVINDILYRFPSIQKAILFGSRAKGVEKQGSDIDIALVGTNLHDTTAEVAGMLNDESPLPYFFDCLDYDQLTNHELRAHIDRVGILLYQRDR